MTALVANPSRARRYFECRQRDRTHLGTHVSRPSVDLTIVDKSLEVSKVSLSGRRPVFHDENQRGHMCGRVDLYFADSVSRLVRCCK